MREVTFINESGLYSLILDSKLPQAKDFKHWVTSDVLPQIRKTGGYIPVSKTDDDETILAKALCIMNKCYQKETIFFWSNDTIIVFLQKILESMKINNYRQLFMLVSVLFISLIGTVIAYYLYLEKKNRTEILQTRLQSLNQDVYLLLYSNPDLCSKDDRDGSLFPTDSTILAMHDALFKIEQSHKYEGLRLSIFSFKGDELYGNSGFRNKELWFTPEILQSELEGEGFDIRYDSLNNETYFYGATCFLQSHTKTFTDRNNYNYIIWSAIPYNVQLRDIVSSGKTLIILFFVLFVLLVCVFYYATRKIILFKDKEDFLSTPFAQDVAHELKTPVASLQCYLEALQDAIKKGIVRTDVFSNYIGRCLVQCQRLSKLVIDITTLVNIKNDKQLCAEPIKLHDFMQSIKDEFELPLSNANMSFIINIKEDIVLNVDKHYLGSIFENLTDNAIKYAGNGSSITVESSKQNNSVIIEFSDNGNDVPEKELSNLFDRFYRIDKSRSRKMGGSGLGLAIVKESVETLNGTIAVKNLQNGGLQFIITL